jgi:hypothetical protein
MKKRAALMGGMGYPVTELQTGMPTFKVLLEKRGFEVILVNWAHRQDVYNFMHGFVGFKMYAGDSLGAGSAGQYPGDLKVPVEFAAGFQASDYDARTREGQEGHEQIIAGNLLNAHEIFDPYWIDTGGLGHTKWVTTPGSKTKLMVTEHRGAHPDDWSFSQAVILGHLDHILLTTKVG